MLNSPGRVAGIDYGTVRIGIAITDVGQTMASPYENYQRRDPNIDAQRFRSLVEEEDIVRFVVGLPVHVSGDESQKSKEARKFGSWLENVTGIPVDYFDERYSTKEAEGAMQEAALTSRQRKKRKDMVAAQVLLSAYLESRGRGGDSCGPLED